MSAIDTACALLFATACFVFLSFGCIVIVAVLLKK
jgi:hypothetical protein